MSALSLLSDDNADRKCGYETLKKTTINTESKPL
jgi:hypothetical protein